MKIKQNPNISIEELSWYQKEESSIKAEIHKYLILIFFAFILFITGGNTIYQGGRLVYIIAGWIQVIVTCILIVAFELVRYITGNIKLLINLRKMFNDQIKKNIKQKIA